MRRSFISLCVAILALSLPLQTQAQKSENANHEDSYYLKGAVPEVNGRVVFTKEYSIAGMSKDEVFAKTQEWMKARMQQNANKSRVAYVNEEKGQIAANGEEYIVFSNSALALDRTKVIYQMIADCDEGKCVLQIRNIRYDYPNEKDLYMAEDWITDGIALTKDQSRLSRGFAKWRRKTVDFVDEMNESLQKVLSGMTIVQTDGKPEETRKSDAVAVVSSQVAITPAIPIVTAEKVVEEVKPAEVEEPVVAAPSEAFPELTADKIQASSGKLVIMIGDDEFNRITMTANAGGYLSTINGKKYINTILTPEQGYQALEQAKEYSVVFYPNGASRPSVVMRCVNVTKEKPAQGRANIFTGEITSVETP